MDYKGYLVRNGKLIDKGSSREDTKGIKLNRVESIDKVWISRRRLLTIAVLLVALFLGVTGQFGPPMDLLLSYGSFLLITATVLSSFTTDRYAIKTSREKIEIPVKGPKGQEFLREIQKEAPVDAEHEDIGYGGSSDPYVDSVREKQANLVFLGLILVGGLLAVGVVAPMYSDNVTWEKVTAFVETTDNGGSGDLGSGQAAVYDEEDSTQQNTFTSEYATVEFQQGASDLDRADSQPEKYIQADITVQSDELLSIEMQTRIPEAQNDRYIPAAYSPNDSEWARYQIMGEFRLNSDGEPERVVGEFEAGEPYNFIPINGDAHIGVEQRIRYRGSISLTQYSKMERFTDKFIKGRIQDESIPEAGEIDPSTVDPEEVQIEPDLKGFQQGDVVRIVGNVVNREGNLNEVVLAEYTVQ